MLPLQVAHQSAPSIICLDDAHLAFPMQRHADSDHPSHRMRTELLVQLEQLAALQEEQQLQQLQEATRGASAAAALGRCGSGGAGDGKLKGDQRQRGAQRVGAAKPAWGGPGCSTVSATKGRAPMQVSLLLVCIRTYQ
jgi:hypothetical protein